MNVSINSNFLMKNLLTDVTVKSNNRLIKEGNDMKRKARFWR